MLSIEIKVKDTSITYYKHNNIHRTGGPAIVFKNGDRYWYQYILGLHRNNAPAMILKNGDRHWYQYGFKVEPHSC
jgi:hypothetical protein